jgi:hypothetical protein
MISPDNCNQGFFILVDKYQRIQKICKSFLNTFAGYESVL